MSLFEIYSMKENFYKAKLVVCESTRKKHMVTAVTACLECTVSICQNISDILT